MTISADFNEVLKDVMENGTKEELKSFFLKIYNKLKKKYETNLSDLERRFTKPQVANEKNWKSLGQQIMELEIELFFVRTWVKPSCDYCDAFLQGKDDSKDYEWLREGIINDIGIDKKHYHLIENPVDWNWRWANRFDHPHYKQTITREGMNWYYMHGIDIEGFPSLRVKISYTNGEKAEEVVDGFGIYWYVCPDCSNELEEESPFFCKVCKKKLPRRKVIWEFNVRDMIYGILEDASDKVDILAKSTHRRQDDGNFNDPLLQHKKLIRQTIK